MVAKKSSRDNHETQLGFAKHPAFSLNFLPYSEPILNKPFNFKTSIFENFSTFNIGLILWGQNFNFLKMIFKNGLFILEIL